MYILLQLRYDASDNAPIIMEEQALFEQDTTSSDGASSSSSMNASRATTPAAKGGSSNGGGTATVHAHDEQQQQSHGISAGPEQDRSIRVSITNLLYIVLLHSERSQRAFHRLLVCEQLHRANKSTCLTFVRITVLATSSLPFINACCS
jgi:hypothetical protein